MTRLDAIEALRVLSPYDFEYEPEEVMDMHVHSMASDGVLTPKELVEFYHEKGFTGIVITDHDGTAGLEEAEKWTAYYGMKWMPGIEIGSVIRDRHELHILGYEFQPENEKLQAHLEEMRLFRIARNQKLLDFFVRKGIDLRPEDLVQREGQEYIGKPNFARALVSKGYAKTVEEAFRSKELLAAKEPAALKQMKVLSADAVSWIREAGGWAVLAHPMKTKGIGEPGSPEFFQNLESIIAELCTYGLAGVEVRHPSAAPEDTQVLIEIASRHGLITTRGSDFHGIE